MAAICSWAQAVLPNTTDESELFIKGIGVHTDRVKIVPNGVEERFASAKSELFIKTYGIKDFILNVGHVGPERKNVYRLIEAIEGIDRPSVIIGRIEDSPEAKRCLVRAKQNQRLLVLDNISHDSELLASAYAACSVFALPSQFETPGIAALEAALAGARIVITKYGGTKMYFGEDAEYVEYKSVPSIRQGILRALEKPSSEQLRERILKSFTWKTVAEETKKVYGSVLKALK
jgi:glycosyltransferase involved in cell wall biosynthesis